MLFNDDARRRSSLYAGTTTEILTGRLDCERMSRFVHLNLDATRQGCHHDHAVAVILGLTVDGDSLGAEASRNVARSFSASGV